MNNFLNSDERIGSISSPGRICLFGEHQDYLGLPVIPLAIDRRLTISFLRELQKSTLRISSDALSFIEVIDRAEIDKLSGTPFDHIKAVFKFYHQSILEKILPSEIKIRSRIPIKSGLSSSAALIVSTVFLVANVILQENLTPIQIADVAYLVEHDILGISCGRMDQASSALGGLFHMTTSGIPHITPLDLPKDSYFVIGDSEVSRKADVPLKHVQKDIFSTLKVIDTPDLISYQVTRETKRSLTTERFKLVKGILGVRDNTKQAFKGLKTPNPDLSELGTLLNEQHTLLRSNYKISHPKIDRMCEEAIKTGALGAKITGAGFGGCMFALTDSHDRALKIRDRLSQYGKCFVVQQTEGVKIESIDQV